MFIDIHSHVVPDVLPFGLSGDGRWPRVVPDGDHADVVIQGNVFRRVQRASWDLTARRDAMAAHGVHLQVLSPMPELFSYWAPVGPARRFCTALNQWIAQAVASDPEHFAGLGVVPLQDLDAACEMMSSLVDLGLVGVEVGSSVEGVPVCTPRNRAFFEEATRLGLCVFIHSFHSALEVHLPPGPAANAITFPLESGFNAAAIVANGIAAALPDLRVGFSHGGGTIGFASARLQYFWETSGELREQIPESPRDMLRRFTYDSLLLDGRPFRFLLERFGPRALCVGTDYPFFDMAHGIGPVAALAPDDPATAAVASGNARRFLGLDATPGTAG